MTDAPERIWTTGNSKTGSWNNSKTMLRGITESKYIRADIVEELVEALDDYAAVFQKVQEDPLWRTDDNKLWPDMCAASLQAYKVLAKARGEQE